MRPLSIGLLTLLATGCVLDDEEEALELDSTVSALSDSAERARITKIRDVAAAEGMTNAALLAGIAQSETLLAHCWSEATWACKGPASPSCGGGPVIAGSGDGACSLKRGGLGLFQFDAGTHSQTLARDGREILELEGNIHHAVGFVGGLIDAGISGVSGTAAGIAWMNSITMKAGDAKLESWAETMACRYNGCCANTTTCRTRRRKYRDNALMHYAKYGADFWKVNGAESGSGGDCPEVPRAGRIIDEEDACFVASGPAATWRSVDTGHGGGSLWTMTTASDTGANIGTWQLELAESGRYRVDVHLDGGLHGESTQALYEVRHFGSTSEVVFDQSVGGSGFNTLGVFDFAAGGGQHLRLADNTGEPGSANIELLFDAIQLIRVGDADDSKIDALGDDADAMGCAAGGRSGGPASGALGLGLLVGWRRARTRAASASLAGQA